jgi:hypothetical protein
MIMGHHLLARKAGQKLIRDEQASIRGLPRGHTDFYRLHIEALMLPIFTVTKIRKNKIGLFTTIEECHGW